MYETPTRIAGKQSSMSHTNNEGDTTIGKERENELSAYFPSTASLKKGLNFKKKGQMEEGRKNSILSFFLRP